MISFDDDSLPFVDVIHGYTSIPARNGSFVTRFTCGMPETAMHNNYCTIYG